MFALAWQYLLGRAVATDPSDRQTAEWPPHPDRVFMALVAAWSETGADPAGAAALEWLEAQPAPAVTIPAHAISGATPKVFVPVNDLDGGNRAEYGDKLLALLPTRRTRKERWFPSTVVGDGVCVLRWSEAIPAAHREPLLRIIANVTNLGHSSSLVRMWIEPNPPSATWIPVVSGNRKECSLRVPEAGRLAVLLAAFGDGAAHWQQRPPQAPWCGYRKAATDQALIQGAFDDRLLILRRVAGNVLDLRQTVAFTGALRGALMKAADTMPSRAPEILAAISGHQPDGTPATTPHVAYLPLPFVGSPGTSSGDRHADGHLLGFALAMPRGLSPAVADGIYDALLYACDDERGILPLTAGAAGACDVAIEERPAPPLALRATTWCAPSRIWGTVTPIVLDRFPRGRAEDRDAETAATIAEACVRQGLPVPVDIAILAAPAFFGPPLAREFPTLPRKSDGAQRWMVHAAITFAEPVGGPLILGAGRYRGYGLCRPRV